MKVVKPFITQAQRHLVQKRLLQIVVRSEIGGKKLTTIMNKVFGNVNTLTRKEDIESSFQKLERDKLLGN